MAAPLPNDRDVYLRIQRPHNQCLLCGVPLNIDGRHPSLIELSEKEEVVRKDFCPTCWEKVTEKEYFSFWITKRVNATTAAERRLARADRNEALWRLFAALYSSESNDVGAQLFLLAHLLMRYRVLQFNGAVGGKLRFSHPKLGEVFDIDDLPLDGADFAAINAEIEKRAIEFAPRPSEDEETSV